MAKFFKKKSKRMCCKLKYKIAKKVAEHNRKVCRNSKTLKKLKDIGIPNSLPFKNEILREYEQRKIQTKKLKDMQKESNVKRKPNHTFHEMLADAATRVEKFVDVDDISPSVKETFGTNSKTFFKDIKTVVEDAEVILQVLDARDPLGTRSRQIEDLIIRSGKKLVLVLNKIDLIPKENLQKWLKYLRRYLPTVAFKASTQEQSCNLSQSKTAAIHINESLQSSSRCIGAPFLMKILGNYCRSQNILTSIKVGVVGFPNVGKSSVINSLKRCRSCSVGATPGVTKSVQEVSLDKHIKIIDSPGVVVAKDGSPSTLALRNAVKVETLKDVFTPAEAIIQRVDAAQLSMFYTVPEFSSSSELFSMLAKRMGRFKRGGVPNCEEGAKRLIKDWTRGAIKYFTLPPEDFSSEVYLETKIVAEMSKAFDISEMEEEKELDKISYLHRSQCVMASNPVPKEEKMELDETAALLTSSYVVAKLPVLRATELKKVKQEGELKRIELKELQQNKAVKKQFKKMQKNRRREIKAKSTFMKE